jgi:sigma-B regulation protein RsbU (phosphoserine phosphatase)
MIADATGHGLPSALITAAARSCFSVMQKLAEEDRSFSFSPSAMLKYANRVIFDAAAGKLMMTFFVGVFDFADGEFRYASAGHNPPWFFRRAEGKLAIKSLTAQGNRLGEAAELTDIEEKGVSFAPGDTFFFYTDGLTEGLNRAGDPFGKKRVRKLIEDYLDREPRELIGQVTNEFHLHNEGKPFDDDVTMAVARVSGGSSGI